MKRRIQLRVAAVFLCSLFAASFAPAQTPEPQAAPAQQPSQVITSSSTIVLVPAMVTAKNGDPVFTLTAKDFSLTDDGVPQTLTLEENSGDEPIALVVAIQTR